MARMTNYPDCYVLKTIPAIARYVGVPARTLKRWIYTQGFLCGKLPNGAWATTPSLVALWLRTQRDTGSRLKLPPRLPAPPAW
jgi:hypothetical protein